MDDLPKRLFLLQGVTEVQLLGHTAAARDTEDLQVVPRGKNQACRLEVLVYCLAGEIRLKHGYRLVNKLPGKMMDQSNEGD